MTGASSIWIGTASRQLPNRAGGYTVGVLVQSNFAGLLTRFRRESPHGVISFNTNGQLLYTSSVRLPDEWQHIIDQLFPWG